MCVSSQHPVFILPDGAAERVLALPVWRSQCHPVVGPVLLVWHRHQSEHAAIQVYDKHYSSTGGTSCVKAWG